MRLSFRDFNQSTTKLAKLLLGKVIFRKFGTIWLKAVIIETEAYELDDKGSHASLGYTEKKRPLFMPPGTIYMYYARGGDSFNVSAKGLGNAVLIKSAYPYIECEDKDKMIETMQQLNPHKHQRHPRSIATLCSGQTLLCKSLHIKVPEWNGRQFHVDQLWIGDVGISNKKIITTKRLGIPIGRDENKQFRYILKEMSAYCSKNPIRLK